MELLNSAEAAELLGVSKWHVSRMVRAGKLAAAVQAPGPRGAFLFDPEAVRALAESRRTA
ncbi:helix-turn-helix domain-containing protein [Dietzia sp. 179-F 9C3 NHS]|uniref:helix-turn-helix domain-containing protein n=1 Tax=Dietzia sp. 179-F 9C3 NHS TaxID=3374295 RepID=UPI00387961B1